MYILVSKSIPFYSSTPFKSDYICHLKLFLLSLYDENYMNNTKCNRNPVEELILGITELNT